MNEQALKILREGGLLVLAALAAFLLIALWTYSSADPAWSHSSSQVSVIQNSSGVVGAWFADVAFYLFGYFAWLFPLLVAVFGWVLFRSEAFSDWEADELDAVDVATWGFRFSGLALFVLTGSALASMHFGVEPGAMSIESGGGVIGDLFAQVMETMFSFLGGTSFLLAGFFLGLTLLTGLSWLDAMDRTGALVLRLQPLALRLFDQGRDRIAGQQARKERTEKVATKRKRKVKAKPPKIEPVMGELQTGVRLEEERQMPLLTPSLGLEIDSTEKIPPLALLAEPVPQEGGYSEEALKVLASMVENKLLDFNVEVSVVAIQPGPVITRFELEPAPGLKASKITNLAKDLARSLSVRSVRVVEVIPGKSVIGLEIPNEQREMILLSELLRSKQFEKSRAALPVALGKDISGQSVVVDLAKMPHLLVAGTTGSGKSVGINAMILSLLYRCTAEDVRMIMIDPKMLELSIYEGIPHLLAPVVTDMKEAANALRWAVAEMERRYKLMSVVGVRNLGGYNRKVNDAIKKGTPMKDPLFDPASTVEGVASEIPDLEAMPLIVIIVDELADMMMVVGKKVEELIARLAQKARASGIHLVLATQRPSVDVITGLIKANIPTRIAFQVSSRIDSRTILDQMGAEHLLGNGDMLYMPPGTGLPERVHGAFVDDPEVHAVVDYLKSLGEPEYDETILAGNGGADGGMPGVMGDGDDAEQDELYDQAVAIVCQTRRASISGVQRRLKIGYNRAARLVEAMEAAGVVSEQESNGNRQVLAPPPPED